MPIYDEKYIKAKNKFNVIVSTNFRVDKVPKKYVHHTCIACISIDSVMKMEEKYYLQVYLEECKYKKNKIKIAGFIDIELDSDSSSE